MYGLIPNQELQPRVIIASAMARIVNTTNKDAIADSADIKSESLHNYDVYNPKTVTVNNYQWHK